MLDYKDSVMEGTGAKCRRERLAADVNEASGREAYLQWLATDRRS